MIEVGNLHYLKGDHSVYQWTYGKKLHKVIASIPNKPVAIMQDNGDGTFNVAVQNDGHVLWATVDKSEIKVK